LALTAMTLNTKDRGFMDLLAIFGCESELRKNH